MLMNIYLSTTQRLVRSAKRFSRLYLRNAANHNVAASHPSPKFLDTETESAPNRQSRKGTATIGVDRSVLRIQMPSHISKAVWGQTQKYLYLHLPDTPENRLLAELVLRDIQLDLHADCLDTTFKRYLQAVQAYKPAPPKKPAFFPTHVLPTVLSAVFKQVTVLNLFEQYLEYNKKILAETTQKEEYRRYRRYLSNCPQDLHKGLEIRSYFLDKHAPCQAKRIIGIIAKSVEWGKFHKILPADFSNVYQQYRDDIPETSRYKPPQSIQALIQAAVLSDTDDDEFLAFTAAEANAIIEAFEALVCRDNYSRTPWDLVVKFLFWTGCRPGECAALTWCNVSLDCSKITFKASYSYRCRVHKGLKTEGKGVQKRTFPCGAKLRELLLSMRPENYDPSTFVFANSKGEAINFGVFHTFWAGNENKGQPGVLPTLIKAGKIRQYLQPYRTRHTYINIQLLAGVSPARVAKLVGNTAATIHKYYESVFRDDTPPVDF